MRKSMMAGLLVVMAMAPAEAQLLGDPQGVLQDTVDDRIRASFTATRVTDIKVTIVTPVFPVGRGWTVQNEILESMVRQSPEFPELAQKYPLTARQLAENQELRHERIKTGLTAGQAGVEQIGVYGPDQVERVTQQRTNERANDEVNQSSMPPKGTLQRSAVIAEALLAMSGYKLSNWLGYEVFQGYFTFTVVYRDATSGMALATITVTVERKVAVRGIRGDEYATPILPPALDLCLAVFSKQLELAVNEADAYVAANHGRAPYKLPNGYAWLTLGRDDGLVGSNDGARVAGSSVNVTGPNHSFVGEVYQTGRNTAFLSVEGLTTADQELLGQNPAVEIIRDGGSATIPQPVTQPAPTQAVGDVPEIGASPTTRAEAATVTHDQTLVELLQASRPGDVLDAAANLIRSTYGAVEVGTTNLPDPPEGFKWLRVKNLLAATWAPGTVVVAVLFDDENQEASRFQAIVVSSTGERGITWMLAATAVSGRDWVIGTEEPLPLRVSAAVPGEIIHVADDVQVDTEDPLRMGRVNVPIGHFGQIRPVRGLIIALRREALVINTVVVDVDGEKARCAYPLPEQKFDGSWQVVVTPPTAPVEVPTTVEPVEPAPTPRPTMTRPGQERPATRPTKTEPLGDVVARFIAAARETPVGQRVDAPLPSFRNMGEIGAHRPDGMWMGSPVSLPTAERARVDIGQVVEFTRSVGGERQAIRAVVMSHILDADDASKCHVYTWLFEKPEGDGWHLDVPK